MIGDKNERVCIVCSSSYRVTTQRHEPSALRELYCPKCRPEPPKVGRGGGDVGSDRKYHGGEFNKGEW